MHPSGASDAIHLLTASQHGRVLFTHNEDDFTLLHTAWLHRGTAWNVARPDFGILIAVTLPHDVMAREIADFLRTGYALRNEMYTYHATNDWHRGAHL